MALWWKKYMDSEERDLEEDLKRRKAEFKQQMAEMKEMDKYERKKARKERLLSRPGGSFKSKKKKAHWAWLAELEQKSPQAAAYYRYTQERKGAQKRWKSEQKRRAKKAAWDKMQRANKRAVAGDLKKAQWIAKMGGPHAARHKEYNPASMTPVQVGKSGAPQFMSLASMGYKSPAQLGFQTQRPQSYKYTPRGTSARGGRRRSQGQGEGQAERYWDWNSMQWVTPQEPKKREGRGPRQAPRAWAEGQESLGRPSDYRTYLADRRLRMSTGLQDPMGSAIGAGQQAAGMVGQGIDRINPNKPGNIFHSAGQWLGGMAPSRPKPSFPVAGTTPPKIEPPAWWTPPPSFSEWGSGPHPGSPGQNQIPGGYGGVNVDKLLADVQKLSEEEAAYLLDKHFRTN